jgi:hypothetical protein
MSRLAEQIALLDHASAIAGRAIWPAEANVSVPAKTLQALFEQLAGEAARPAEYRLISHEAVWLMQAAKNVVLHRADKNAAMAERWLGIAELLDEAVAADLENARKSIGEVGQ